MKFFELIPSGTNFDFVQQRWRYISLSIVALAIAMASLVYNKIATGAVLNYGIDFAGGSQIQVQLDKDKDPGIDALRDALVELGYESSSAVVVPDKDHEVLLRVKDILSIQPETALACQEAVKTVPAAKAGEAKLVHFSHPEGGSKFFLKYDNEPQYRAVENVLHEAGCQGNADPGFGSKPGEYVVDFSLLGIGAKLQDEFDERFGVGTVVRIVRSETVGAKVGGQLKEDGAKAMLYAIGFIFLYVMVRFDLRFAPGGIVALIHDALLVVGAFSITGKEFNLTTIAAILSIIGYSINDTIVVFDRIRERVILYRDDSIEKTTNAALNDTLSRTILTSGTTLLVVVAIYVMGSGTIQDFAFALTVGIVVGTYSSLFIATPVFLWVNHRFYGGEGHLRWAAEKAEREGTGTLLGGAAVGEEGPPSLESADGAGGDGDLELDGPGNDPGEKKTSRRRRRPRPDST